VVELSLLQKIIVWALPVLFAITVHEVAHGWVALKLGDRTAQMLGRLTLNPFKHIDPIGTLLVPGLLLTFGGFIFGWAKPVPVNDRNLHDPKSGMALVAVAGPVSNLIMAFIWALIAKIALILAAKGIAIGEPMLFMGVAGILINTMLMVLNLLPLPPLDGGRVWIGVLPGPLSWQLSRVEPYGFFILLGLAYFGILNMILGPLVSEFIGFVAVIFGLPPQIFSIFNAIL
jgi:Zn-dependent protease